VRFTVNYPVPPGVQLTDAMLDRMLAEPFEVDSDGGVVATGTVTAVATDEARTTIAITVDLGDARILAALGDVEIH
jgi:lysozyme family protein